MPTRTDIRPDFLIVGTMKSGTSTLADYMAMHPGLHLAPNEVHYFDKPSNFAKGPDWYAQQLLRGCPPNRVDEVLFGEKTPTYSYQENCAARVHELVPDAKLIWIFRDPVKRAYSNYLHRRKKGQDLLEFANAVRTEDERLQTDPFAGYVLRSRYILQIERFAALYPIEQMHFLLFEDLVKSPIDTLNPIADFLGVGRFPEPLGEVHSNVTRMPLSRRSLWAVGQALGYESYPYKVTRTLNNIVTRPKPAMPKHLRAELVESLRPDNDRLAALTGLDLSAWYR